LARSCRWRLAALVGVGVILGAASTLRAEPLPAPVIAVVDIQRILHDSEAAKSVARQIDSQRQAYLKEISAQEESLRQAGDALDRQRTELAPEDFARKRQDLERRYGEVQQAVDSRKRILDQIEKESFHTVQNAMMKIVQEVAVEDKANVVLARDLVLVFQQGFDITNTVMDRLNRELPQVVLTIPQPDPVPPP
jgi:Skp family chaperone for outer membrane proteins